MPQTFPVPVFPGCLVRPRRWRVVLLVCLAFSLNLVHTVQAATTWTVCARGCNYKHIKAAIGAPTTLNDDTLAIAAGTYTEPGITINKRLTLKGETADTTIVQAAATPGTASNRVFTIRSGVTVTLQDLTIRHGNRSQDFSLGGGIYNRGTLTVFNSTISGNANAGAAGFGGGLHNDGTLTLTNCTVSGNFATSPRDGYGGGLANFGTLTLMNSTVSGNFASGGGGGIENSGTLTLTNSTVSGNSASSPHSGFGGGLDNFGTLTLMNSTVSGNSASAAGGGLYNDRRVTLTASTVSGNSAPDGGGIANNIHSVTLTASIVASNPIGRDCANFNGGSITSKGDNLDSDGSCQLTTSSDLPGTDPLLGPLQDNGGPTLTQALLPGSPAIDVMPSGINGCGTTLFSDQRWQARPQPTGSPCDIGAYEVAVPGQALGAWVTGFIPHTVVCTNVTTGQAVTLSDPASPWDCEAAGLGVSSGDQVALRVSGSVKQHATDVGGAVAGMAPHSGGCTNLTTGQSVSFQYMVGATAGSCLAAGLVMHPGDSLHMHVQGSAE
jgi:hypothetical protein